LLILVEPTLVPGPMLLMGTALMVAVLIKDRISLDLRGATWALVGRLPGSLIGALLVVAVSQSALSIFLAVVVLFGATATARGWVPRPTRTVLVTAGATSGIMGTATSVGAPPMAVVWQSSGGPTMRATMSAFLLVGAIMSLVSLTLFGALTTETVLTAASLLPAIVVGYLLSAVLVGRVDERMLRTVAITVSVLGALTIIVQQVVSL
jgi:uncharacterized membrane protein YfcA